MTTERTTTFRVGGTHWRPHTSPDGRTEWRSDDGGCIAGRHVGRSTYWARCGAINLGGRDGYATRNAAMVAAVTFKDLRRAAA